MAAALHFDAVITPNRSLGRRGFRVLMTGLIVINLVLAGVFWSIGALPIPFFLGLDVLGVFVAFRINNNGARQHERVQVSAEEVRVLHEIGAMSRLVWRSPTAFTRVEVEGEAEDGDAHVRLALSGRSRTIGNMLSPGERADLAQALREAIRQARAERYSP